MSESQLHRALFASLAFPALLLTGGCTAEVSPTNVAKSTEVASAAGEHETEHASERNAASNDHGGEAEAAGHDDHAGHDDDPAAHETAAVPGAGDKAPAVLPPGHSADDGHDHSTGEIQPLPDLGNNEGARLTYDVGKEKHVFGRVMQGSVQEHTFALTNTGTEDLIIKQVKPTCGCTVAQVFAEDDKGEIVAYTFGEPIAPGRNVQVPAKLHTKNKSGHQNTRINVFSNDPRGTVQLGLEADIDPFFNIAPRFLNFGQISAGDVVTKKAVISTSKGTPVALTLVEQSLPPGAQSELVPVDPDGEGKAARWDLTVTLGPDLVEGNLARAVMVTSNVEIPGDDTLVHGEAAKYQASITLSAQVVGPFSYNPPYLSMGLVRPGQVASRTVQIESHDDEYSFANSIPEVRVVGLQNPGTDTFREWDYADRFTTTIRPVEGKNAIDVELRLEGMPDTATGSFRGTLVIELGHKDKKQIALVITGVCRGGPPKTK